MDHKIAALTREGLLAHVENCTEVILFKKKDSEWIISEQLPFRLEGSSSAEIRDCVRSLILELGNCSVVVAKSVLGVAYHVFDRMGFSIFEAEELDGTLLDGLILDMEQAEKQLREEQTATVPIPMDDQGRWFLDLISLQEKHPEISSKQALRDFLQKKTFLELTLLCTHVPPWLDAELPAKHLGYAIEEQENGVLAVTISRILCKE
jgi:Fe-only nitrogenase accessory protein AnfO